MLMSSTWQHTCGHCLIFSTTATAFLIMPAPPARLLPVLHCMQVLRFMHQQGVVHCDCKPDNFVLPYGFDLHNPSPVDIVYAVDMGERASQSGSL